jgi:hypothetical protein
VNAEPHLPTKVTFDFNEGDMVTTVEVADGASGGGWGITRIEVISRTPIRPDFVRPFLDATAQMIANGWIPDLIALHDAEQSD